MSAILGKSLFFKFLLSFWHFGIVFMNQLHDCYGVAFSWRTFKWWKRLDPCGLVPEWFKLSTAFFTAFYSSSTASVCAGLLNFCESDEFVATCGHLSQVDIESLLIYTDSSLKYLGTIDCRAGAAAFFEDIGLGLGVVELQTIALALECVPATRSVKLFSDSQTALDACRSELSLMCPDFHNQCWVKRRHIRNVIHSKNLKVSWHKVKGHFSISGNNCTDGIADAASLSGWFLPPHMDGHFLLADGGVVSDIYHAVCHTQWEVSSGSGFLVHSLHSNVDWLSSSRVWHSDLHMATGFTSRLTVDTQTYLMKALHCWLPVAVRKRIYNKCYPSVLCLYCSEVEVSDHVFSCVVDDSARHQVLESGMFSWRSASELSLPFLVVLQFMSICASDLLVSSALYKGFVFNGWLQEAVAVFHDPKIAGIKITDFMHSLCSDFRNDIWLIHAKHCAFMEKNALIPADRSISIPVFGSVSRLSSGVVKLLGVTEAFSVLFGFCKSCSFFSDIDDMVSVNIVV
ncbi:hypothetical protein G9A89_019892 [Geosiphon pyriformis]|nr:hypothetical protein G9A89_019892 [Geosiphon pyriformis]